MKSILLLICFILTLNPVFSQMLSQKSIPLPDKLNSIDFLPKERLVLSPDGSLLCFMNDTAPFHAFLINASTGVIEDSIGINSYGPQIKWSGDSKTIIFYTENYSGSKFELYSRKGDLKGMIETRFPVLNFEIDNTASEIAAIQYYLPETGAPYSSDITGAYIYPKGKKYNYRICLFDVTKGQKADSFSIKTTYPRISQKWKGNWTLLINESDAEFQAYTYAATIDFVKKQILPIGNSKDLFLNESLMNMQMWATNDLYISTKKEVYELDKKVEKFKSIMQSDGIENVATPKNGSGKLQLVVGSKGQRWAQNVITIRKSTNEKYNIDIRDLIPHIVYATGDTATVLTFSKKEMTISKFSILTNAAEVKPEILVQNSIEPDNRLIIPNTPFLLEYNNKAWQVTDLSSQLIVHQQKDFENYGTKIITAGNNPFIIKYNSDKAEIIPVGKWNELAGNILLEHPLLKEGSSVYSQTVSLHSLTYNTSTSLLTGIFKSNEYFYAAAWNLQSSNSPAYVIKLERKKIPNAKSSSYSEGSTPLLLAEVAYLMKETDWKKAGAAEILDRFKKFTANIPSFLMEQLKEMNDYSWKYNIEQAKATGSYTYQDSIYGHIVIDLVQPSQSVYFCHKQLKGDFSALKFAPYKTEGFGIPQVTLSDKGNFVTVSNLGHIAVYDLKANQYLNLMQDNKEQSFDGKAHYFVEDKGILLGTEDWYATTGLNPIHTLSKTLYIDSASYFPDKKLFVAHTIGQAGYVAIHLDNLTISHSEKSPITLKRRLISDTTIKEYFPDKKHWIIAGQRGLGYDSSQKMTPNYMGRLFPSTLNGNINYIQMFAADNKVLIGNTDESAFELWDAVTEQRVFKLVITDANNFIIQGSSGYYYATPNALQQIGFIQKGEAIPASFLDAGLNRPDIVLAGVYDTTESTIGELVGIYRKAAQLKNRKNATILPGRSPIITIPESGNTLLKEKDVVIKAKVVGVESPVNYFSIQINNVLVWDTLLLKGVSSVDIKRTIQLSAGENQLVFQAKDTKGFASVPVFQRMVFQPEQKQSPTTYIIALAVNNYSDDSRNLKYAVKDGKDILTAFRSIESATVIADSLFDSSFTVANISRLKDKLMQTTIEDKVIVSFSGHGMLDDSLNFYLATYDMDFENPGKKGLIFSALEEMLSAIPARKKLLLIDACNSGNIDKDANQPAATEGILADEVRIQSDTVKSARGVELPVPAHTNLQQIINQLFVSSSSKGGIEVIAATAGNAYAYEAPQWNNGVFTYALLQTFNRNSDLDKNFDGQISIKEIKQYVYPKVVKLTNGLQQPLSRFENPNYDWNLIPMRYD